MQPDDRSLVAKGLYDAAAWQKSPFIQGFLAGLKGFIVGAGAGSLTNSMRGKNPVTGALIGGAGVGLLSALAKSTAQEIENSNQDQAMRYHLRRIAEEEPTFFMPPPKVFGPLFERFHAESHRRKER